MPAPSKASLNRDVLASIPVGVPVFDKENRKVGDVNRVQVSISPADAYTSKPLGIRQVPEEIQQFLMQEGYVQINTGLLCPEHFALPDQIESISYDGVYLNVPRDLLLAL